MTKHSKNATTSSIYRYHEHQKDSKNGNYGTQRERLSKHSIKNFDCCSLTLQPCQIPVVTTDGDLFDKESIIEYIITCKKEINKQLKTYEKILKSYNKSCKLKSTNSKIKENHTPLSNMIGSRKTKLNNFWVASAKDDVNVLSKPQKPEKRVLNPVTQKPIKMKDLFAVNFKISNNTKNVNISKRQYVCAATGDELSNRDYCAVFKTCGNVVKLDYIKKLIKDDQNNPFDNTSLSMNDIIILKKGSCGFATQDTKLVSSIKNPTMT